METTKRPKPDLSDLWKQLGSEFRDVGTPDVRAYTYVAQARGPVITLFTNQPVDLAALLAQAQQASTQ